MRIAVQGCCHGALDEIYNVLQQIEKDEQKVDLLLCCGDFQAVRNCDDLSSMAVPNKYKSMGSFYKYYSGEKTAPVLTIFIGGNHEASNHLRELGYGGWVAPNIYYLGHSGVVRYGGLRIAGASGIYKRYNYNKGHYETPPYNPGSLRSAYHIRSCDVFKLKQLTGDIDIMMSHDWPLGIHQYGDCHTLFKIKPYFRQEADQNELGSPPAMELLCHLSPSYWFSAHLHVKFAAVYRHEGGRITKFLALDKCLPRGGYLQVFDVPSTNPPHSLEYDLEWLSIVKATEPDMPYTPGVWFPPDPNSMPVLQESIQKCKQAVSELFKNDYTIPHNFQLTSPPHKEGERIDFRAIARDVENPQTAQFCARLEIKNPWCPLISEEVKNPQEISLDSSEDDNNTEIDYMSPDSNATSSTHVHVPTTELTDKELRLVSPMVLPPPLLSTGKNPEELCLSDDSAD